jgi:SAM-dependent methyltransferase
MPSSTPNRTTISLHAVLELSTHLDGKPRERCPLVRFTLADLDGQRDIGVIRSDEEKPRLDLADQSVNTIDIGDILSRVMDEEAWLAEMCRVLTPGGYLSFTLPAGGPLAWLDARNIYRYLVDIVGRGDPPDDTLPTGWHRHYSEEDVRRLLEITGFEPRTIQRVGIGFPEVPQLAGLLVGNFLLGRRDTEMRLRPLRVRTEAIDQELNIPKVGTTLYVLAARA